MFSYRMVMRFAAVVCVVAVGVLLWMAWVLTEDADDAYGQESITAHDSCEPPSGFVTVPYVRAGPVGVYLHSSADGWCYSRQGWRITHTRGLLTIQSGRPGTVPWATYSNNPAELGRLCNNARTACHTAGTDTDYCPMTQTTPGYRYRARLRLHTYGYSFNNPEVTFHHVRDLYGAATSRWYACGRHQP